MIAVTRFRGTYFLCEFKTERNLQQQAKRDLDQRQKEMEYWGWKFEQYVTAGRRRNH
jgi:RAT1-interacting protein